MSSHGYVWSMFDKIFGSVFTKDGKIACQFPESFDPFLRKVPVFLEKFPQSFIPQEQSGDCLLTRTKTEFIYWLLYRLLALWSSPIYSSCHENIQIIQEKILSSFYRKSPSLFTEILQYYILFLEDTYQAGCQLFDEIDFIGCVKVSFGPQSSSNFETLPEVPDFSRRIQPIVYEDGIETEEITSKILSLLRIVCNGIQTYLSPSWTSRLLTVITLQIELGGSILKRDALCLLDVILTTEINLSIRVAIHLYHVLSTLLLSIFDIEFQQHKFESLITSLISILRRIRSRDYDDDHNIKAKIFTDCVITVWKKLTSDASLWKTFNERHDELTQVTWECLETAFEIDKISTYFVLRHIEGKFIRESSGYLAKVISDEIRQNRFKCSGKRKSDEVEASPTWMSLMTAFATTLRGEASTFLSSTCILSDIAFKVKGISTELYFPDEMTEAFQYLFELVIQTPSKLSKVLLCMKQFYLSKAPWNPLVTEKKSVSFLSIIVALCSLPWKLDNDLENSDLYVTEAVKRCIVSSSKESSFLKDEDSKRISIEFLTILPRETAPKWRWRLLKQIWCNSDVVYCQILVANLPFMMHTLGKCIRPFADDVVSQTLRLGQREIGFELTKIAFRILCIKAETTRLVKDFESGNLKIICDVCDDGYRTVSDTLIKLSSNNSIRSLLDLIGFGETKESRINVTKLIPSWSKHVGFERDVVRLWLNYFETQNPGQLPGFIGYFVDSPENTRITLNHLSDMRKEKTTKNKDDVILVTSLIEVARVLDDRRHTEHLVDELTALYLDTDTHVGTFVQAQDFLRSKLIRYKSVILNRTSITLVSNPASALNLMTALFRSTSSSAFLVQNMHHLLPQIVLKRSQSALDYVSEQSQSSSRHLLAENFQYIFPQIVVHAVNSKEYAACIKFLENSTKVPLKELLPSKRQRVTTELLMKFHSTHKKRVLSAFQWLVQNDTEFKRSSNRESNVDNDKDEDEDVRSYISPKFLGVLGFMDQKLRNVNVSRESKFRVLQSLNDLLDFMGSNYVGSVKHKILALFQSAFSSFSIDDNHDEMNEDENILIQCWTTFTNALDSTALGSVLSQVLANLVPLLLRSLSSSSSSSSSSLSDQIVSIFRRLIIDRGSDFRDHFDKLYFLPDIPELEDVNGRIRQVNGMASTSQVHFRTILTYTCKSLESKNFQVKLQTLRKLKTMLRLNTNPIQGLIVASDTVDPAVTSLIVRLVQGVKDDGCTYSVLGSLYGQCLGELGAIDPGRLHLVQNFSLASDDIRLYVHNNDDFAESLLTTLVQGFLRCTEDSDSCAYSIQEILKRYRIKPTSKIWSKFPDEIREVLTPLLTSLYSRTSTSSSTSMSSTSTSSSSTTSSSTSISSMSQSDKTSSSKYSFENSDTFRDWIVDWSCHLISKIRDEPTRRIFEDCKPAIRRDIVTAKFLIPYIVVETLIRSDYSETLLTEILEVVVNGNKDFKQHALYVVFSVLDHGKKFLRKKYEIFAEKTNNKTNRTSSFEDTSIADPSHRRIRDTEYLAVERFIDRIPSGVMAKSSFECHAYARSLLHFEHFIRTERDSKLNPEDYFMLQRLYGALEEPDCVVGLARIRTHHPSPEETIHELEATGNYQDALAYYESVAKNTLNRTDPSYGMIRCYMETDQPYTAFHLTWRDDHHRNNVDDREIIKLRCEAAWQLGQWDVIESVSDDGNEFCWEIGLAKLINCVRTQKRSEFYERLSNAQREVMIPISAAANDQGSYSRSYRYVVRLQMLNEIETLAEKFVFTGEKSKSGIDRDFLLLLKTRLTFCQYSLAYQEPVLKLRRTLFQIALSDQRKRKYNDGTTATTTTTTTTTKTTKNIRDDIERELYETWLTSAKVARKSGQLQKAYNLLTETAQFEREIGIRNCRSFVERAKLLWARGDHDQSIDVLTKGIDSTSVDEDDDKSAWSEAKLLLARYLDDGASIDAESLTSHYKEARDILPYSETGFYYSAKFYDKIIGKNYRESDLDVKGDFIYHVICLYGKALLYGSSYLHEALPRVLSLWLDFGARVFSKPSDVSTKVSDSMSHNFKRINEVVIKMTEKWPPYYLLTVFPQLTSRICHPHPSVWSNLKKILIKTFTEHPQHVFWHMVALSRSSYPMRKSRCKEIFQCVKINDESVNDNGKRRSKLMDDSVHFTDMLLDLCVAKLDRSHTNLRKVLPTLFQVMNDPTFSRIMMPITINMSMMLPTSSEVSISKHDPFPSGLVYFVRPESGLSVMKSLVKPKRVTFLGSNGSKYSFLCKPKDDLRRDCRLIDFNNLLNKLLTKDSESRKRDLHIRTYTVFPLDELNGIIEWIENVELFRVIVTSIYKERFGNTKGSLTRDDYKTFETSKTDFDKNMKNFRILKRRHPPVFGEWFLRNFPDPQAWYSARLAYIRTTAVMSMVCYLFGLGDRHAENIMFDSSNGDTVHVDLNCLFNKGDTLTIPEVVPFRLTHNMVDAMGPLGVEGPFRIACEVSLGLMRKQKDVLTSTLRPFYFDPLVDWIQDQHGIKSKKVSNTSGEVVNEKAVESLKNIENRLNGYVETRKRNNKKTLSSIPLSISGQVNYLINEATSEDNLSQMFLGWAPYL